LKNTGRNIRSRAAVNEIEEFQTVENFPDAVTVEKSNRQRKKPQGRYEGGQGCRGPLHALVCYKCGKGADFYRKHPSKADSCPIKFHDATCKMGTDTDANPAAFARSTYELARERIFTGSEDADSETRTTRKILKL